MISLTKLHKLLLLIPLSMLLFVVLTNIVKYLFNTIPDEASGQKCERITHRILVLGSDPTALGVLYRLNELGVKRLPNVQIIVLEPQGHEVGREPTRDDHGFLWDNNGVGQDGVFGSQYKYFTKLLDSFDIKWNEIKQQSSFTFAKDDSDNDRKFTQDDTAATISYDSRFPKYGGSGKVWNNIADKLPKYWFHLRHKLVGINIDTKQVTVSMDKSKYDLHYDVLINTEPLDMLINKASQDGNELVKTFRTSFEQLNYQYIHIIGLGLSGQPPETLQDKSWIYFPDSDSPFYRATVFSSYADDNVPNEKTDKYWSLMCEAAQPKADHNTTYWSKANLIEETIKAMVLYGYIKRDKVVSKYYYQLDHGYPVPSIARDGIIKEVQPWLESKSIYSRGRFGGWKYEVGNQDHSFMQGVELADSLAPSFNLTSYGPFDFRKKLDYEFVFAHYDENISHLLPYASHSIVYNKGPDRIPDFRFRNWKNLPNVGREGHTILYHIVNNYETLADVTVFMQAGVSSPGEEKHCFIKNPFKFIEIASQKGLSHRRTLVLVRPMYNSEMPTHYGHRLIKSDYTFSEYWKFIFGIDISKFGITWFPKSCFGVTRERIHQRKKSFYERMLKSLSHSSNPLEGHYAERMWLSIFN